MPCIIALIIFSILGIFSASHRALAKEAFSCVLNRVTFRPCNIGFKEKIKGKVLSNLINRSVFLTRVVNKHYEILSWIFFILMVGSTVWVFNGMYNYYVYGSCNGLNESGFCAFDPSGENNKTSDGEECGINRPSPENVTLTDVDLSIFPKIDTSSKDEVVFVGCYGCKYTREVYPEISKLLEKKKFNYIFAHFPVKKDSEFLSNIGYCVYKDYEEDFWKLNDYLFTAPLIYILNKNNTIEILEKFDFDIQKVMLCSEDNDTKTFVERQRGEIEKMNIYGTPTIFINKKPFIGPKPYRVYKSAINKFIFF